MYAFDRDVGSRPSTSSPFDFAAEIASDWAVNGLPNGGYLMALLARAVDQKRHKNKMAIATANFIQRTFPGAVEIRLDRISETAQFERFDARLLQQGRLAVAALVTCIDDQMTCRLDRYETGTPHMAPLDQCIAIPQMPNFTLFDQVEVRLDPACAGWMTTGQLAERSEHKGWVRFRDGRPYDALSVLLVADCFPPPVYATHGLSAWVPTVELSVNLRKMPVSEWLKCRFRTRFITCGLLEEDGQIWDEAGELVAISRQIAQYRV